MHDDKRGFYNCDEKWIPKHRCKAKFQCVLMEESGEHEACMATEPQYIEACEPIAGYVKAPNISYHAMCGHFVASNLQLRGNVFGKPVTMLVDSGSTHNFVHTRVVKQ